ncbi:ribbon-helix-helix protein, CopG family [Sphingomonas sp. 1P06PA]|uniref:CopG family ribbon-helix-helix protein n=1 Tax=Sphingomonas sp. 1P06PA TaxID=554121 RepID=UPI0039A73CF1
MSKSAVITARLDAETLAKVDRIAEAQGRSRSWFVAQAVREVAEREADFIAFVQVGIDEADRGALIAHDVVMAELDEMIARQKVRCRS